MTPRKLASSLLCLPPILYMNIRNPISGYSKAPWGLSVLSQVSGIFTGISISPSPLLRQRPDRFAFRAGRNLPDKEFRYLRTVIVTAAVYWGFGSKLALFPLTFQHRAGVSHYTSSCDFAMTCVLLTVAWTFSLRLTSALYCPYSPWSATLLPKLRVHFAEFLNKSYLARLSILYLSTCVGLRYGHLYIP